MAQLNYREMLRTSVPALFFLVQNNLQYIAAGYLDVPTNIILYQSKLLWCAVLSVACMQKAIAMRQWV